MKEKGEGRLLKGKKSDYIQQGINVPYLITRQRRIILSSISTTHHTFLRRIHILGMSWKIRVFVIRPRKEYSRILRCSNTIQIQKGQNELNYTNLYSKEQEGGNREGK